jgi:hypothetical protein
MGLEVLQGFMGAAGGGAGGGAQKGSSDQLSSTSGDAKSNSTFDFSGLSNAFTMGGSGTTSASAANDKNTGSSDNIPLYLAMGIAGLAVFGVLAWSSMRRA